MRTIFRAAASSCVLFCLMGCPPVPTECIEGTEAVCEDAGGLPPDFCNSQAEAEADSVNCHLNVTTGGVGNRAIKTGAYISRLSDAGVDQDWYFAQAPGGLSARSLLHIGGGYSAAQTAVNFSVNVLRVASDGGFLSVATGIDRHGAAAPRPIDLIVPFDQSNARLFALVADEGASGQNRVDNRSTYSLFMEIIENPDVNEPNDTTPTPIALAGAPLQGSGTGYLATNDDVDVFSFAVPAASRQIIYMRIQGPDPHPMSPPPPFKLSYTLFDPSDRPIAEGFMANEFLRIDLATARLAPMAGTYKVAVKGFKPPTSTLPVKGDLRVQYTVSVQLLPDVDAQEGSNGNDTGPTARTVNIPANGSLNLTGKLSYVADEEWFLVSLPARSSPSTLRYRVTAATGGGRFAPLTGTPARQLRVLKRVTTGATAQDRQVACRTNNAICPHGDETSRPLVDQLCDASDPPLCLYAQRNEELPLVPDLRNLVGAVPVTQNQATEFLVQFRDEGQGASKYADDRDWTLNLEWQDDADEAGRVGGPTNVGLSGATTVSQGELSFGYGRVSDPDRWFFQGAGLRRLADYDALETDRDLFQFNFGGAMGDQAWEISWELLHPSDGGSPAGDIALELTFCGAGAAADGGLCTGAQTLIYRYNGASLTPWYLPMSASNGTMLFSRTSSLTSTTITALPIGCSCFSAARTAGGTYFANIAAIDRTDNDPIRYRIRQRIAPYPANFTARDGGAATCPVVDAGCGFARP